MRSSDHTVKVRETLHNVTTNIVSVQHGLTGLGGCLLVTWIVTPAGAWGCSGQGGSWHASDLLGVAINPQETSVCGACRASTRDQGLFPRLL